MTETSPVLDNSLTKMSLLLTDNVRSGLVLALQLCAVVISCRASIAEKETDLLPIRGGKSALLLHCLFFPQRIPASMKGESTALADVNFFGKYPQEKEQTGL